MTTYIPSLTLPSFTFLNPAVSILLPVVAGAAVGYSTRPDETQKTYMALKQPPLSPPAWVYGPVWTAIYATMGYTAHRATIAGGNTPFSKHGMTLYTIQLGLNLVWMPLFFRFKRPVAATVDILALGGTVSYLAYVWGQVDPTCAWLLAPYLGWLSFATYLCIGTAYLNDWNFSSVSKKNK